MSEPKPVYVISEQISLILEFGYDPKDAVVEFVDEAMASGVNVVLHRSADFDAAFIINFGHLTEVVVTTESKVFEGVPAEERRPVVSLDLQSIRRSARGA
jgi:hypothetical protein